MFFLIEGEKMMERLSLRKMRAKSPEEMSEYLGKQKKDKNRKNERSFLRKIDKKIRKLFRIDSVNPN